MLAAASWALALTLGLGEPTITIGAPQVDAAATAAGLRMRAGEALEGWSIDVRPTDLNTEVTATLRSPDGAVQTRAIVLGGTSVDERSRELASALALIVEQHEPAPKDADRSTDVAPPPSPKVAGWLGAGPRVGLGPLGEVDPDVGADLRGGLWVVRDHLQPVLEAGWSRSVAGDLHLDGVRFGGGLLAGAGLAGGRVWLGAGAIARALWARGEDRHVDTRWLSSTTPAVSFQYRGRRGLLLGARAGADVTLPPLRSRGQTDSIRWGILRFSAAITVGFHL